MREFLSHFSNEHMKDMNEDIIKNIRKNDNMVEKIEEICIEIAKSLHEYVTYLGADFDDSKNRFREANASKKKDSKTGKYENVQYINVNYTYSRLAVFHFRVQYTDPRTLEKTVSKVDMPIAIPQFIDDYHYYIRGNYYSAPYQLIFSTTYKGRDDSIVLKTLTRAIKLSRNATSIKDMHGVEWKTHKFYMHVASKKIPFVLYYFAYFGFFSTMRFFGAEEYIKLYEDCPVDPDQDTIYFKFGKLYLGVDLEAFQTMYTLKQLVATILDLGRKGLDLAQIRNVFYWRMILGSYISQTRSYDQGAALITTFVTCLDKRTIQNIAATVGGSEKTNSWTVLRWMFITYSQLASKNMSLQNMRLRYAEYIVTPIVRDMQAKLYRFLKTRTKMRDLKRLIDVLRVSPNTLINSIIGKVKNKRQMLNITKYTDRVNDLSLLNSALKFSKAGPGSSVEVVSAKRVGAVFRQLDISALSRICLITSSSQSVGLAGNLTPFTEIDNDTMMFKFPKNGYVGRKSRGNSVFSKK